MVNLVEVLKERVAILEQENSNLKNPSKSSAKSCTYQVLHVIEGDKTIITCLEPPSWTYYRGDRLQSKPETPLLDPTLYLDRKKGVAFVVYKFYTPSLRAQVDI